MDELKKLKRIYSGELLIFSIIFLVLGILFLCGVIGVADWKRWAFTILTLVGGAWFITDFIWCLLSPKKRAKTSMLDKALMLPMAIPVFVFDIVALSLGFVWNEEGIVYFRYVLGIALTYYGVIYLFQAFYHYKHPIPMLYEALEEELAEKEKKEAAITVEAEVAEASMEEKKDEQEASSN